MRAGLGIGHLGLYLVLKVPFATGQVLPPAVLLGVILNFGLLSRTHEIMAIKTSGLDILRLTRPVIMCAGLLAGVLLVLNLYVVPWSQGRLNFFWETQVQKKPPRSLINLEHFWYKGDQAIYNIILYRKDIQTLEGVKIYFFTRQFQLSKVVIAKRAIWQCYHWRFYQGLVQTFEGSGGESGEKFQERDFVLTEQPADFGSLEKKTSEMDAGELLRNIDRLERDGYKSTSYRVEFHNRLSLALTPMVLALLGLGLALREEQYSLPAIVALGMGLSFAYWLLSGFSVSFGQAERWPVLAAVWLPHGLVALLALELLRRARR